MIDKLLNKVKGHPDKDLISTAYKHVFNGGQSAQIVLEDLIREGRLNHVSFLPGDTHGTAFNEGKKYMLLHVLKMLAEEKDLPKLYHKTIYEE